MPLIGAVHIESVIIFQTHPRDDKIPEFTYLLFLIYPEANLESLICMLKQITVCAKLFFYRISVYIYSVVMKIHITFLSLSIFFFKHCVCLKGMREGELVVLKEKKSLRN